MSSFIKDGTSHQYEMKGYLNDTEKPVIENPSKGYVAMCNNKFAPDGQITRSSLHEITTGRAYRLEEIITSKIKKG
jgi:acyl-homoserine lactone acylase PvdQ